MFEKNSSGTLLCLRKILVSKIIMHKRGRSITILRRIFLSHSTGTFRRGTLPGFKKNSGMETFHALEGGGAVSRFSVVIFKLKNVGKGWDSNPYLPLQNHVVLPTVPWEPLE